MGFRFGILGRRRGDVQVEEVSGFEEAHELKMPLLVG